MKKSKQEINKKLFGRRGNKERKEKVGLEGIRTSSSWKNKRTMDWVKQWKTQVHTHTQHCFSHYNHNNIPECGRKSSALNMLRKITKTVLIIQFVLCIYIDWGNEGIHPNPTQLPWVYPTTSLPLVLTYLQVFQENLYFFVSTPSLIT